MPIWDSVPEYSQSNMAALSCQIKLLCQQGSTYKRKASKAERAKETPTLKDLDFLNDHPEVRHCNCKVQLFVIFQ